MSDYIKREDVIDIIEEVCPIYLNDYRYILKDKIADLPSADVVERKHGKPDFADCEKCSKIYGTFGCCSTVSNEWIYSCLEGMLEYAFAEGAKSVERKRGEWIAKLNNPHNAIWLCSACNYATTSRHNFCPNCGADMRAQEAELCVTK